MDKHSILCFGDSNTWGYDPQSGDRFKEDVRWPTKMAEELGESFYVIEEGLNARTTCFDDPFTPFRSGKALLPAILESHKPLDTVVIMLGTNDLKSRFNLSAWDISKGVESLVFEVYKANCGKFETIPEIVIVSPLKLIKPDHLKYWDFEGAEEKLEQLSVLLKEVAVRNNCHFIDAAQIVEPSSVDGMHLDEEGHKEFSKTIGNFISQL